MTALSDTAKTSIVTINGIIEKLRPIHEDMENDADDDMEITMSNLGSIIDRLEGVRDDLGTLAEGADDC